MITPVGVRISNSFCGKYVAYAMISTKAEMNNIENRMMNRRIVSIVLQIIHREINPSN
jgi:hypothetical protein